ncbi:MAG: CBS domain-containing protein, partial [Hydrogenophaga sp.]|nr:CBS domain-containing protein [Hydrogenophaga sp.]
MTTDQTRAGDDGGKSAAPGDAPRADDEPEQHSPAPCPQPNRTSLIARARSLFRQRNGSSLRDDLTDALSESADGGEAFSADERAMLHNILRFREIRVEDVMIPRADIRAVELETTLGELMTEFETSGHSRMPVYGESLDDPRGMVHIRDVVAHITRLARQKPGRRAKGADKQAPKPEPELDLRRVDLSRTIDDLNLVRPVLFVPPSMLASVLLARMQAQRIQMALVIDEYGGSDGLVSLEDIVE